MFPTAASIRATARREWIAHLEQLPLAHTNPRGWQDRTAIKMVKCARWCSDRCVRDHHLHRALMPSMLTGDATGAASSALTTVQLLQRPSARRGSLSWRQQLSEESLVRCNQLAVVTEVTNSGVVEGVLVLAWRRLMRCVWYFTFACCPRFGHRFIAYAAEENAVVFTHMINDINLGKVVNRAVPPVAREFCAQTHILSAAPAPNALSTHDTASEEPLTLRELALVFRAYELESSKRHHRLADVLTGNADSKNEDATSIDTTSSS
jgi:hypothetical protein